MEKPINPLVKSFTVYYNMTKTKPFIEMNYLDKFMYQIDTTLFFNFKNAISELEASTQEMKHPYDNFKIMYQNSESYGPINHQLLIKGIQGLIIFDKENKPLIIRDYALERNYEENIEYYSAIALAIKKFADFNLGIVTDIGLGNTRALVKIKKHELTVCMFISEILYWRITGEIITMFMELTLKDILRSFSMYLDMFNYNESTGLDDDTKNVFNEQIDLLLLENSKVALKELNY